jgi:carbon monoxide dehydrogenase subunit G
MAEYVAHVRTPLLADDAFAYMADLRNFAVWDPGVTEVEQIRGEGGGSDAEFDVTVKGFTGPMTLRYRTVEYVPARRVVVRADGDRLTSLDVISVHALEHGAVVTYDAQLTLGGALRLTDPLLRLAFRRIGDRAAHGLVRALDGSLTDAPPQGLQSIASDSDRSPT